MLNIDLDRLIVTEEVEKDIVYEDNMLRVYKVLLEIPENSKNWVKRVQIVKWKNHNPSYFRIDIRNYSKIKNIYGKGITFSFSEFTILKKMLEVYDPEKDLDF